MSRLFDRAALAVSEARAAADERRRLMAVMLAAREAEERDLFERQAENEVLRRRAAELAAQWARLARLRSSGVTGSQRERAGLSDGGYSALIVDDETDTCDILVQIVRARGLRVFAASDGQEALRILRDNPVDLLLADIVMPGMDGVLLAAQAKLICPAIKVLFTTGYARRATERDARRLGKVLFKPFRAPELVQEMELLLGAGA